MEANESVIVILVLYKIQEGRHAKFQQNFLRLWINIFMTQPDTFSIYVGITFKITTQYY